MKECKLCIIGTGSAGLLVLFCLSFTKIPPEEIVLIDPYHDGGDLQRKYASVQSNTHWSQMLDILRLKGIAIDSLPLPWQELDPNKPTSLKHYIQLLQYVTKSYAQRCEMIYSVVSKLQDENGKIKIVYENDNVLKANICILATGSTPKLLHFPIPTIPLEIALQKSLLSNYIEPNQTVCVFGTAHSGTLILHNLHELNVQTHAFYKGNSPFLFARDGEYDGIKQESETIADAIVAGKYPFTHLHSFSDTAEIIRWSRKANWVIYATGFERTNLTSSYTYDGTTGKIKELPNTWGFGIAFPNRASDGIHWDVSIPSFFSHIETQVPKIVESFYA
jgi:cation diffusion facilitator CzcD-associated flavoprotein CzcO